MVSVLSEFQDSYSFSLKKSEKKFHLNFSYHFRGKIKKIFFSKFEKKNHKKILKIFFSELWPWDIFFMYFHHTENSNQGKIWSKVSHKILEKKSEFLILWNFKKRIKFFFPIFILVFLLLLSSETNILGIKNNFEFFYQVQWISLFFK